ncbi:MAG: hypothetical protein K6U80_17920 [Firmicutes bacterium]|nr:hypothetical protein [Bacillota bacterium]
MWLKLTQFRAPVDIEESQLPGLVAQSLSLPAQAISGFRILRKSLDARHHRRATSESSLSFVYTLAFEIDLSGVSCRQALNCHPNLSEYHPPQSASFFKIRPSTKLAEGPLPSSRTVIAGSGPAGLFTGLYLAAHGFKPIIIERGDGLEGRVAAVDSFWKEGKLDPESNIQFGIGGAGTFSDGKLTTRIRDPYIEEILAIMVRLGAPAEILYWQRPHIGTDLLRNVVGNLQDLIREYGGEIRFRNRLTDLIFERGRLRAIMINDQLALETDRLVLATGNGARDLYDLLFKKGLKIEAKPFAVGVRIEHPQDLINRAQYGRWAGHPKLGPAEYQLAYHHPETGRGVYTFCMCPGGVVVGATSQIGGVVTNGMSYYARNSGIANSAVVVTVGPKDFGNHSPLAGAGFQKTLEERAFACGGGNYSAPAQSVGDFLRNQPTTHFSVFTSSYLPGSVGANLRDILPPDIGQALQAAIKYFGTRLKGFDWPDAVLTGVETRTSAPVRIIRNSRREAEGFPGIFPVGEGAGYAGGIISSAVDGWKTAVEIVERVKSGVEHGA